MNGDDKAPASLKPSIMRLKTLREQLCSKQTDWKIAFEVRDYVLDELTTLHQMLLDNTVARTDCIEKTENILSNFEDSQMSKDSEG